MGCQTTKDDQESFEDVLTWNTLSARDDDEGRRRIKHNRNNVKDDGWEKKRNERISTANTT